MRHIKEKRERSLGVNLNLKGDRCNSQKCALNRRPTKPGIHGGKRRKPSSEYGLQLNEKQKIMFSYGLKEKQMRAVFKEALRKKESVTDTIIQLLERRLDNAVFRLGFAPSRVMARQFISHGHILVNKKKVRTPSFIVKPGDTVTIKPSSGNLLIFKDLSDNIKKYEAPAWLSLDKERVEGKIKSLPKDIDTIFDVNLVVDFYATK